MVFTHASQPALCNFLIIRFNEAPSALKATCVPFMFDGIRVRTATRHFQKFHCGKEDDDKCANEEPSSKASSSKRSRETATASIREPLPPPKKKARQNCTLDHFGFVDRELSKAEVETFHSLLVWLMCSLALPFRFVDDFAFQQLIRFLRKSSQKHIPDRRSIGGRLLTSVANGIIGLNNETLKKLQRLKVGLSMALDGWTTVAKANVIAVMLQGMEHRVNLEVEICKGKP